MRVLFVTNLPSPYRVDIFNKLGEYLDLTVCYERETASDRNKAWKNDDKRNYSEIICKGKPIGADKSLGLDIIKKIKSEEFSAIIISGYSSPSVMMAIIYCRIKGIPYIIESDGGFSKKDSLLLGFVKKSLLKPALAHLTTCEEHKKYLTSLGISQEKVFKYPFSSLWSSDIFTSVPTNGEKAKIKEQLGIGYNKVIVSVGQFIHRKGYDILLEAARQVDSNVGIYIIGGKPTPEYLEYKDKHNLQNVHFIDFMSKESIKRWFAAADVFVLPTREDIWGLVINEAMACALPIVTTARCIAGLELIQNGENGYIVPVENSHALAEKMNVILSDDEIRGKMCENNLEKIKEYTIENIAIKHIEVLKELMERN